MLSLESFIPPGPGLLPKWQLIVAIIATLNAFQNFMTVKITKNIYKNAPVTPLQARTFGIWNVTSAVVRCYCAYNVNNKAVYQLTMCTYIIAGFHFFSEYLYFRTAALNAQWISPIMFAVGSLSWMIMQYDFYVET